MNISEYQRKSIRTMKIDETTPQHCCLGIAGEVGEVVDLIKKTIYYGKPLDKQKVKEELGDVMFYIVNLATSLNLSMENILEENIEKLNKRFPNGFTEKDAIERKDESGKNS